MYRSSDPSIRLRRFNSSRHLGSRFLSFDSLEVVDCSSIRAAGVGIASATGLTLVLNLLLNQEQRKLTFSEGFTIPVFCLGIGYIIKLFI